MAGLRTGSSTDVLSTSDRAARRRASSARASASTPRSPTRRLADAEGDARARLGDARRRRPRCPRAAPPTAPVANGLAAGVPGAARAEEEVDLDVVLGAELAIRSISASVSIITPLPCETRWTGTPRAGGLLEHGTMTSGPSQLGISTRYRSPSGNRASEARAIVASFAQRPRHCNSGLQRGVPPV